MAIDAPQGNEPVKKPSDTASPEFLAGRTWLVHTVDRPVLPPARAVEAA